MSESRTKYAQRIEIWRHEVASATFPTEDKVTTKASGDAAEDGDEIENCSRRGSKTGSSNPSSFLMRLGWKKGFGIVRESKHSGVRKDGDRDGEWDKTAMYEGKDEGREKWQHEKKKRIEGLRNGDGKKTDNRGEDDEESMLIEVFSRGGSKSTDPAERELQTRKERLERAARLLRSGQGDGKGGVG